MDTELAAAKNGLVVTQLSIKKLKAQIAKLRREKFGASSERIEHAIEQLELALEEAEAAKAEAIAAQPQPSEAETASADEQPIEDMKSEKKKAANCRPNCRAPTSCIGRPARARPAVAANCVT